MARPARFTDDDILDGVECAVFTQGPEATIADVAKALDAPVGSIYHRFSSREELFVAAWIRGIRRFHMSFLTALDHPDPETALVNAAVEVPRWCNAHPRQARTLMLYRHRTLLQEPPPRWRDDLEHLNEAALAAVTETARRRWGRVSRRRIELAMLAVQQLPYGLTRPHIGGPVPASISTAVRAAVPAVLALGDTP